mgnify:CR=1 FL=1
MVSRKQLKIFVEDYEEVPYKVLNYVGAEVNYGGRVTDDKDSRLITTILRTYVCPEVMQDGHKGGRRCGVVLLANTPAQVGAKSSFELGKVAVIKLSDRRGFNFTQDLAVLRI